VADPIEGTQGSEGHWVTLPGRGPVKIGSPRGDRAQRAKESYVAADLWKQQQSTRDEIMIAKALNAIHFGGSAAHKDPLDLWNGMWAVEVKTRYDAKKDRMDMRKESRLAKYEAARALKTNGLSIAIDRSQPGEPKFYWSYGFGAFRYGGMSPTTLGELRNKFGTAAGFERIRRQFRA
jgi:hypothetical protein